MSSHELPSNIANHRLLFNKSFWGTFVVCLYSENWQLVQKEPVNILRGIRQWDK